MTDSYEPTLGISHRAKDTARGTMLLFIAFILLGAGYIFYAKEHSFGQKYVTFGPVVIMLVFAAIMLLSKRFKVRDDQAGDNLYYMGFVFTLISLGTTLYQFSDSQDKNQIVQNFGIAIATTICGIVLRIFFAGMRQDPIEVERQARLELAEAARLVKIELDSTAMEFSNFSREMKQILEDRLRDIEVMHKEMSGKISSACEGFFISIDDASKRSGEKIEETAASAADSIKMIADNITKPITEGSQELRETLKTSSASLTSSLGMISRNINNQGSKITASSEQINSALKEQIDGLVEQIQEMRGKFAAVQTPDKAISLAITPALDELIERVSRFEKVSSEQNSKLVSSVSQLMTVQSEDLRAGIGFLQDTVAKLDLNVEKASARIAEFAVSREVCSVNDRTGLRLSGEPLTDKKQPNQATETDTAKQKRWFFS